jgi:hypothetical protein
MECGPRSGRALNVIERLALARHGLTAFRLPSDLMHFDDIALSILSDNVDVA